MSHPTEAFYRTLVDAMPLMLFVVDGDMRIHDLNAAAATGLGLEEAASLGRRGGDAFQCLHAQDAPAGCGGGPFCRTCVLRTAVTQSMQGHPVTRRRTKANVRCGGGRKDLELLVTTSPLPDPAGPRTILILEDVSEVATLRNIIPMCPQCKRIRDDAAYWQSVESYFQTYTGVHFSHGLCPTCVKALYPEYAAAAEAERPPEEYGRGHGG